MNLLLQHWHIESKALFWSAEKTRAWQSASGICGKGNISVCLDCIVSPLGCLTEMPCLVGTLLVQVLFGPMKWLVKPESTMARLFLDGLRAVTRLLQENKLFKTKESLELTVTWSYQGAGLKFLCVPPPFFVASSVLLVNHFRGGTLSNVVLSSVAARPAVVVVVATGGLDACSAELIAKVRDSNLNLG